MSSFVVSVDLGVVGDDITSVKLYACTDNECTSCTELTGYEEVLVSSFPMSVVGIPLNAIYIKADSIGRCEVSQCIPIIGIPSSTPTPGPTSTPTPTPGPTSTPTPTATSTPEPTATPTPTATSTPEPTATPTPTATSTPEPTATPTPTSTPTTMYALVGPYSTEYDACVAGNLTGPVLGFYTVTDDNIAVGSIVYSNPLFGTPSAVTGAPGWYAIGASLLGIYNGIRIDTTGTIDQLGTYSYCVLT